MPGRRPAPARRMRRRAAPATAVLVAVLVAGCSDAGSDADAGPTTTVTTTAPTTTTAPPPTAATIGEEEVVSDLYRQGVARVDDDWIFTNQNSIHRTRDDLTLVAEDLTPFPDALAAEGYDHIGDPDVHEGVLWVPMERADKDSGQQVTARYDAETLAFIDSFPVAQHHNAFVAVDDDGVVWSADEFSDDTLVRYTVEGTTVTPLEPLVMDRTIERIQGVDIADGAAWVATDDARNGVYRVDLGTGVVTDLGTMGRVDGEGEGIDATDLPSGRLHTLVMDPAIVPAYFVHLVLEP